MGTSCVIGAPAKINLHLQVGERRADGYHSLESIFLSLGFGDTLGFEIPPAGAECVLDVAGTFAGALRGTQNSVVQAAALFRERTGFDKPLRVRLRKRIPLGGGLGGGSSDAASTLLALDALAGTSLSRGVLEEMALCLGSDVPFFLSGGAAFVSGRGEHIRPLKPPPRFWVLLVNPGFPSATGAAFSRLDAWRGASPGAAVGSGAALTAAEALCAALEGPPGTWPYGNDFLPAFLTPGGLPGEAYAAMLGDLRARGAEFTGLSGSGSTCFGVFTHKGAAEEAKKDLVKRWNFVELTFFLARSAKAVLQ
jgi:4-diphosphocytidyl-2-C-methyl-D-erythritol kinase